MALHSERNRYRVEQSEEFNRDWEKGVSEGWINPMADPVTLMKIKEILSYRPWASRGIVPGLPANVCTITFPRSAVYELGRVQVVYAIIEDDRVVNLRRLYPTTN